MVTSDDDLSVQHNYDGERCEFCGQNIYDVAIYGPEECTPHPLMTYTTETP